MSVETGQDIPHDVFGGTLSEVGPSNMPSGGSPANLNVEFLPGLVRTRGGLQIEQSFSIPGGPYQVRYSKSYGQTPESQVDLVLLFNPAENTQLIGIGPSTVVGNVFGYGNVLPWAPFAVNPGFNGPFAKSSTQFGREYIAISEGRYGFDLPRQWDGTNFDRVSQCGPGKAPTAVDSIGTQAIAASPNGLGQYAGGAIAQIYEIGNTVYVIQDATNQGMASIAQPGDLIGISGVSGGSDYTGTWSIGGFDAASGAFFFQHPKSNLPTVTGSGTLTTGYVNLTLASAVLGQLAVGGNVTVAGAGVSGYDGVNQVRLLNTANGIILPTDPCIILYAEHRPCKLRWRNDSRSRQRQHGTASDFRSIHHPAGLHHETGTAHFLYRVGIPQGRCEQHSHRPIERDCAPAYIYAAPCAPCHDRRFLQRSADERSVHDRHADQ